MRLPVCKALLAGAVLLSLAVEAPADASQTTKKPATPPNHGTTSSKAKSKAHARRGKSKKGAWKRHGQQEIQPARANAIQQALIREKYLTGEPSGQWDARTQAAMARYQSDHGWQSKVTPDSRALIKLGLGPDYSDKNMMLFVPKSSDSAAASASANVGASSKQQPQEQQR